MAYDEKTLAEKGRKELRRMVERIVKPFRLPMKAVTLDIAIGRPAQVIADKAEKLRCDLIVMGAHGRTGANRLMIGSTTHRILRKSRLPVLATPPVKGRVARPPRNWPGKTAIAPVDFGPRDRADVLAAAVAARDLGVQLELVHVVEPIADVPWLELDEARRNQQRERRAAARLTRLQDDVRWNVKGVRVESGKPGPVIASIAASEPGGSRGDDAAPGSGPVRAASGLNQLRGALQIEHAGARVAERHEMDAANHSEGAMKPTIRRTLAIALTVFMGVCASADQTPPLTK